MAENCHPPSLKLRTDKSVRLTSIWFDCAHHESLSTSRRLSGFSPFDRLRATLNEVEGSRGEFLVRDCGRDEMRSD